MKKSPLNQKSYFYAEKILISNFANSQTRFRAIAGYFAVVPDKNFLLITVMQIAAQGLFFFILSLMPRLLRLPFYPSYAAFTFPFVITASALRLSLDYYARLGVVLHEFFQYLYYFECIVASFFVFYVTLHFCWFFYKEWRLSGSKV